MTRKDLPSSVTRDLAWRRRALVRDVGRTFDALVDAGVEPEDLEVDLTERCDVHVLRAVASLPDQEAA